MRKLFMSAVLGLGALGIFLGPLASNAEAQLLLGRRAPVYSYYYPSYSYYNPGYAYYGSYYPTYSYYEGAYTPSYSYYAPSYSYSVPSYGYYSYYTPTYVAPSYGAYYTYPRRWWWR